MVRRCSVKIMYERMDPEQLGIVTLNAFLDEFFPTDSHKAAEQVQSFTVYHYNGLRNSCPAHKVWPTTTTVYATSVLVTRYGLPLQWSTQLLSRPQGMVYHYNGLRNSCPAHKYGLPLQWSMQLLSWSLCTVYHGNGLRNSCPAHKVWSTATMVYATLLPPTRYGLPLQWSTQLLSWSLCTVYHGNGLRNSCPAHKVWSTATMVYATLVLPTRYGLPLRWSTQLLSRPQGMVYRYHGLRNFCPGHCTVYHGNGLHSFCPHYVLSTATMVYATSVLVTMYCPSLRWSTQLLVPRDITMHAQSIDHRHWMTITDNVR